MKRMLWWMLSIGFVVIATCCNNSEVKNQSEFYYYPKTNVYFDVSRQAYVYTLNGGKSWESLTDTARDKPETLGEKVVIYSATDSIWNDNEAHRKLYGGVLYNVPDEDSSAASATVSERETASKRHRSGIKDVAENATERKHPIKKFFEKLFKKKKNR